MLAAAQAAVEGAREEVVQQAAASSADCESAQAGERWVLAGCRECTVASA